MRTQIKIKIIELRKEEFIARICCGPGCGKDISDKGHRAATCSVPCFKAIRSQLEKEERDRLRVPMICVVCGQTIADNRGNRSKYCSSECKKTARWGYDLTIRHNITPAQFFEILENQGGGCGVCGVVVLERKSWNVDHDHSCCSRSTSCGKCVRGILCNGCNGGMGFFRDSPETLMSAAAYLIRYNEGKN